MKSFSEFVEARNARAISILVFLVVAAAYLPSLRNGFVNLDDPVFVYANPHVQRGFSWQGLRWAFTSVERGFWQPVAWVSLMLDAQLFGTKAAGYHFTSLIIHAAAAVVLFLAFRRLTGTTWRSAFVAALFGLHPLHVESVAWVSERKDVLSALFWGLTMWSYGTYARAESQEFRVESGSTGRSTLDARRSTVFYALALVCFALGLMSKSMVVTLPIILLLLDWWPLRRVELTSSLSAGRPKLGRLLLEKAPFFALAVVFGLVTIYAQHASGAVKDVETFPISFRVENAVVSYVTYLLQMAWPTGLAAFYPYPKMIPMWEVGGAAAILAIITVLALKAARGRPFVAVGWFWYIITLLPVIGLLQVGSQAHADRYTYLPSIGIFLLLCWGACELTRGWQSHAAVLGAAGVLVVLVCALLTINQVEVWKSSEDLFRHALRVTRNNEVAHNNLGTALMRTGKADEAIQHFREATRLRPNYAVAHANLGGALIGKGHSGEAIQELQRAIQINPGYGGAYRNIGTALGQQGKIDEAMSYFQKAIAIDPNDSEAHYGYGVSLLEKGRLDEALAEYRTALKLNPRDASAHANLGSTLMMKGLLDEAIPHLELAIKLGGRYPAAFRNLGTALAQKGRLDEAIANLQQAVEGAPKDVDAHYNLGVALLQKGFLDEGIVQFREVLKLNPKYGAAQTNLNVALAAKASGASVHIPPPAEKVAK